MTASYTWVQWNRHKINYDLILTAFAVLFLAGFVITSSVVHSGQEAISPMILLIRAFGILALVLLHVILCIGPLARFTTLVAPLLYNRRHLGVVMFLCALIHAALVFLFYGAFGVRSPISAVIDGYQSYNSISGFPFEIMGFFALLILFTMAATSHDFWLSFLSPRIWKSIHMLVYIAYGLILLHVVFGALQSERHLAFGALLIAGSVLVAVLHIAAAFKESDRDKNGIESAQDWIDIGEISDFPLNEGRVVCPKGAERVAVFRHENGMSAMSNVCAHQGGPLGEGQIVNGCVTCPWHGYQYLPENGQSPPPYNEKVPTYELKIQGQRVLLNTTSNQPGAPVEPANEVPKSVEGDQ
ncbi:MAG: Rieske 2Fe-2S domain-containing protein [Phycisphaerales bacterium]